MLKNYFKIAWRNLTNHKLFSLINLTGLAIGIAACLLILQYVSFELSYDQFHKDKDDIYRLTLNIFKGGKQEVKSARVSPAVATAFKEEFPAIDTYTRMVILGPDGVLTYGKKYTGEKDILLADSAFFRVFSFHLIRGDEGTAFNEPFCVVLTESTAEKLFGTEDPVGKSIVINADNFDGTSLPFKVTGIIENFPKNTHLRPGVLISYPTLFEFVGHRFDDSWQWKETYTYFKLHRNTNPQHLLAQFPAVVHNHNPQLNAESLDWQYQLQPITDIHLHSNLQHEFATNGNAFYVNFLAAVGIFILFIAFVNFVNLLTVKSLQRAKEIGLRKISGAFRGQLIIQVFLEAALVIALAGIVAFLLLYLSAPYFSGIFDVNIDFLASGTSPIWLGFAVFTFLLILGSGFYPAFVISRYESVKVLKGNFSKGKTGAAFRKWLVATQFAIAILLIAVYLISDRQIRYMKNQSLGFNPDQVLVIKSPKAYDYGYGDNFSGFQSKISTLSHVKNVAGSSTVPGQEIYRYNDQVLVNGEQTSGVFSVLPVAQDYFSQYNIPLVSGNLFSGPSENNWIVNETAMHLLGFEDAEQAVGQQLNDGKIIGVVKDFHQESLKTAIPPVLFFCSKNLNYYTVKISGDQIGNTLDDIKTSYQALFPGSPFDYFFLDEFFDRQYKGEMQFNMLFTFFSGLALLITCMGLFGLSSYMASQRTKEIGMRKVLGASTESIIKLLSADFIKLILIASILSLPLTYFIMQRWLENYASRIDIGWPILLSPVLVVTIISLTTVGMQTIKTAMTNPAQTLKTE